MDASLVSNLSIYIGLIQMKSLSIYFDLRVRNCNKAPAARRGPSKPTGMKMGDDQK